MVAVLGDVTSVGRSARDDMVQRYQSSGEEEEGEADGEDGKSVVAYKVSGCCRGGEGRHVNATGPQLCISSPVLSRGSVASLFCAVLRVGEQREE